MQNFRLQILAMDRDFFDGQCESLIVPLPTGQMGIQAYHNNMIAAIVPGELKYRVPGEEFKTVAVSSGIMKIEDNDVMVMVGTAERPEEIDANRAQRARDEAMEAMLQKKSIQEYQTAQANLARALNRLKVKLNSTSINI